MRVLDVDLVTEAACSGPGCDACEATVRLFKEAAATAAGMELGLGAGAPKSPFAIHHMTCRDAHGACAGRDPPLVLINGQVALEGAGWTVAGLRDALRRMVPA